MPWCPHCFDDQPNAAATAQLIRSPDGKSSRRIFTSCSTCGRVLNDTKPSPSLPNHTKLKSKDARIVHDIAAAALDLTTASSSAILGDAHRLFIAALEKEEELFARKGRRVRTHVAAACLYVALRRHRKPYMLIDLSNYLGVTVYVLCAVFVALTRVLRLDDGDEKQEQPFIDPSLFMHRISSRLLGRNDAEVAATALRVLSNNTGARKDARDWMLSTQKQIPIKICSAALYIAATAHSRKGKRISKSEVVSVVGAEFESMRSGGGGEGLTMDEFVSRVADIGSDLQSNARQSGGLVCRHKDSRRAHCCHGLCRECCDVFVKISKWCVFHAAARQRTNHRQEDEEEDGVTSEGSSLLDDVDDREIDLYINNREEKQYKTIIWELMHKEYVEDRAAAVAAEMASSHAAKLRNENKRRRGSNDATTEATKDKLKGKMLPSSRVNYDVLSKLSNDEEKQKAQTDNGGVSSERNNENKRQDGSLDAEAVEDDNESEIYGDNSNPDEDEAYDYFGDYDEDYYNGHYADTNEEYAADDDFDQL